MTHEERVRRSSRPSASRLWRLREWPHDPGIAHLIFSDHRNTPTTGDLDDAIDRAARLGARSIRTSAMFPRTAELVLNRGFRVIDELALLRLELSDHPPISEPAPSHRLRPMRSWHANDAAAVDRAAFGPQWSNTARSLSEIRNATPTARGRLIRVQGHLAAFAITGRAGDVGYLQRVAVDPDHRRQGLASALVADAIDWVRSNDQSSSLLVNTGVENRAALALYDKFGFENTGETLVVGEYHLVPDDGEVLP